MKRILILTYLTFSAISFAQTTELSSGNPSDSTKNRPGQVGFFYPVCSNGLESPNYSSNFSFNVLYGYNGGLRGIEVGGLVNTQVGNVDGIQVAGIANINTKKTNGMAFAGIANLHKDSSNTVSFAGISNIFGKSATGVQSAGISNTVNGTFSGIQTAGICNIANGAVNGVQLAGISNVVNGDFEGVQAAGISNTVNGNLQGTQMGLINTAKRVKGFQLGLINVAESFESGVPLGLFSFVKDGYHAVEISGGEAIYANLNIKIGVEKLYTIYKFGYTSANGNSYLTYGLGLGTQKSLTEKVKISIDLSSNHILEDSFSPDLNLLAKMDVAFRYHLTPKFAFFAGPSFNVFTTQNLLDEVNSSFQVPYTLYETNWGNNEGSTSIWIGGNLGVSLEF
jgi:hypothetical protein